MLSYAEAVKQMKTDRETYVAGEKDRAAKELEDYKKQTLSQKLANKVLLDQGKPGGPNIAAEGYVPQVFDPATITNTYVNLAGYNKVAADGDVKVTIILDAFTPGPIGERTSSYSSTVNKQTVTITEYFNELEYKRPVRLKLTAKDGTVLFDEDLPDLSGYKKAQTDKYKDKGDLDKYWRANQKTFMRQYDDASLKASMLAVTALLNDKFGRAKMKRETRIAVVTDKKVNYDEYPQAYEKAMMGYQALADPARAAEATKSLQEALDLWNKALAEADPKDKKARIDNKVMAVTLLNAAEADVWTNNFTAAQMKLAKLKLLDFTRYDGDAKGIADLMHDQRERFEANKTN